jgi:hypothetical protein
MTIKTLRDFEDAYKSLASEFTIMWDAHQAEIIDEETLFSNYESLIPFIHLTCNARVHFKEPKPAILYHKFQIKLIDRQYSLSDQAQQKDY